MVNYCEMALNIKNAEALLYSGSDFAQTDIQSA